ncbi:MAG: PBECR2 nuclease fold domain-containing protein [Acutalibacteraceae bacterium]
MHYIGKIDIEKYKLVTDNQITTDEVILTENRKQHIIERRGQEFYDKYNKYFSLILEEPDYIFKDERINTEFVSKEINQDGKSINTILRLIVQEDEPEYKNSIITAIPESKKRFAQRLRNNNPVYIRKVDKRE